MADAPKKPVVLDDLDVTYGPGTQPQGPLPFHVRTRRLYSWWPGSERNGKRVDLLLLAILLTPAVAWAVVSFGWMPITFLVAEIILFRLTIYRIFSGTFLD
jgi:hypothetical protein